MCGLVGVVALENGHVNKSGQKAFKTMLVLDVIRGEHSTGILSVGNDDFSTNTLKHVGPPLKSVSFMNNNVFDKNGDIDKPKLLLGHNRYATQGKINEENAHPFTTDDGNLIGAHNGTVDSYILSRIDKNNPYATDSEFIYNSIANNGLEETVEHLNGGAYALSWWNKAEKSFNLLRNSQRPLFIAKSGKALLYASEKWMLEVATDRANINITNVEMLPVNQHYKYVQEDEQPVIKEVKSKIPVYSSVYSNDWGNRSYSWSSKGGWGNTKPKIKISSLRPFLHNKVRVVAKDIHKDSNNVEYLSCEVIEMMGPYDKTVELDSLDVRAYLNGSKHSKCLLEELNEEKAGSDGETYFLEVKIKKLKANDSTGSKFHGVVDLRSVKEIQYVPGDKVDETDATFHAEKHWDRLTSTGCSHCCDIIPFKDKDSVLWVDTNSFFCSKCVDENTPAKYGVNQGVLA